MYVAYANNEWNAIRKREKEKPGNQTKANTYNKSSPNIIIALPPIATCFIFHGIHFNRRYSDTHITFYYTSAHSSVSATIIPQKSSAYFHQSLPLEVMLINPTQPSFTSSSQAVSSAHVSQSYSPSMCIAVYQQPAASSTFYPHHNAIYPPSPVTWTSHNQTIAP